MRGCKMLKCLQVGRYVLGVDRASVFTEIPLNEQFKIPSLKHFENGKKNENNQMS